MWKQGRKILGVVKFWKKNKNAQTQAIWVMEKFALLNRRRGRKIKSYGSLDLKVTPSYLQRNVGD